MKIIGHNKIINFLNKTLEKGTISQAYLFSGPENVGKFTLAFDFAQKLSGSEKKINPDIIVVEPEIEEKKRIIKKKDIKIEQIRELEHQLALSPYFGKFKVAIINEAERLTISAQNALLKTLEEPNSSSVLILITSNDEKILPTIKSRCVIKKFNLVNQAEMEKIFEADSNREELVFWSFGRPGLAYLLKDDKEKFLERKEIAAELKKILAGDINNKFLLAEVLSKNTEKLLEKLDLWAAIFREDLVSGGKILGEKSEKIFNLIEMTKRVSEVIKETNANARLILENLFLNF